MSQVRVNIASKVDANAIRYETRNGRDVIVVPSATLPDNIVMNGVRYPADEIAKAYHTLENTLAPLGHPEIDGKFISASDPAALAGYYVGAYNANVRRENGRVFVDKIIDIEVANALPRGKALIDAINSGGPINTSTGLLCNLADGDDEAKFTAVNMVFDHDAILLNEAGAATPEQGVGMLVNKAVHGGDTIDVINSSVDDEIDYLGTELMRAIDRKEAASKWSQIKSAIMDAIGVTARETKTNSNEVHMTEVTKEQFEQLSALVNEVREGLAKLDVSGAVSDAIAPIAAQLNAAKEAEAAKVADLVEKVVNKGILDKATAEATPVAVLNKLLDDKPAADGLIKTNSKADDEFHGMLKGL